MRWGRLFLIICLVAFPAFAWNRFGHVLTGQIAYNGFSPVVRTHEDKMARIVYEGLTTREKRILHVYLQREASLWAAESFLPDLWRQHLLTLRKTFKRYRAPLPASLEGQKVLHFLNRDYPRGDIPRTARRHNIIVALRALEKANLWARRRKDRRAEALLGVYIRHLLGDLRQPLHLMQRGDDRGGIKFCLRRLRRGRCPHGDTLHRAWDSGMWQFSLRKIGGRSFERIATDLRKAYPAKDFAAARAQSAAEAAAWGFRTYGKFVYGAKKGRRLPRSYVRRARKIARKLVLLAGYQIQNYFSRLQNNSGL